MGKRYYCDFCDKSFADNPTSRKNHLKGVQHQRNRKAHYDSFRDPEIILSEEQTKKPCKIFLTTGNCNYMENCKFSHLTSEDKQRLEKQVQNKVDILQEQEDQADRVGTDVNAHLSQWLKKIHKDTTETRKEEEMSKRLLEHYTVPPHLLQLPNISPSLLPPSADAFENLPLEEWG